MIRKNNNYNKNNNSSYSNNYNKNGNSNSSNSGGGGNPNQIRNYSKQKIEKYKQQEKDCKNNGDYVEAERCLQMIDHYQRQLNLLSDTNSGPAKQENKPHHAVTKTTTPKTTMPAEPTEIAIDDKIDKIVEAAISMIQSTEKVKEKKSVVKKATTTKKKFDFKSVTKTQDVVIDGEMEIDPEITIEPEVKAEVEAVK